MTKEMLYHGDLSGCIHNSAFPDVVRAGVIVEQYDESGIDWSKRGVDTSTKNLGIVAFLEGVKLPEPHEKRISPNEASCCEACDGYVDVESDDDTPPIRNVSDSKPVIDLGQLALF